MKRTILLFSFIVQLFPSALGQNYFHKRYLVSGNNSYAFRIREGIDKAVFIGSNKLYKGSLIKIDSAGNVLFNNDYLPLSNVSCQFGDFVTTADSAILSIGSYLSGSFHNVIVKISQNGSVQWCNEITNIISTGSSNHRMINGPADKVVCVFNDGNPVVVQMDENAMVNSAKRIVGMGAENIRLLNDSGYLLFGSSAGGAALLRMDSLFNPVWSSYYQGHYKMYDAVQTPNNEFICVMKDSFPFNHKFSIMKTDSAGNPIWTKYFNDPTKAFFPRQILLNSDQTFFCVVNWTPSQNGTAVIKMDTNGNLLYLKDLVLIREYTNVIRLSDKRCCSLLSKGNSPSTLVPWISMDDSLLETTMPYCLNSIADTLSPVTITSSVDTLSLTFALSGLVYQNISYHDVADTAYILNACPTVGVIENKNTYAITVSPNPTTDFITIHYNLSSSNQTTISLFNLYGQPLATPLTPKGGLSRSDEQEIKIDMRNFPAGIYFVKVSDGEKEEVRKVVKY
ncbi:MAG TPA: T9SS type A sorting domain-containing protein [Bacteroidia bacterium]|nr:T9SS type A sorting domain-containing protein [Bacteroidia bacterium]